MKKEPKRLKLTKLTVSNLERVKGGKILCACDALATDGAYNRDYITSWLPTACC